MSSTAPRRTPPRRTPPRRTKRLPLASAAGRLRILDRSCMVRVEVKMAVEVHEARSGDHARTLILVSPQHRR